MALRVNLTKARHISSAAGGAESQRHCVPTQELFYESRESRIETVGSRQIRKSLILVSNDRKAMNLCGNRTLRPQVGICKPVTIFHGTVRTAFGECE